MALTSASCPSCSGTCSISITADMYAHLVGPVASEAVNGAANLITRTVLAQPDVTTDAG